MRLLLIIAFGYVCGAEHPTVADESESIMTEPFGLSLRWIYSKRQATTCADFTRRDRVRLLGYDIPPAGGLVARDYATCCSACAAATNCTAFTLDTARQRCYLKSSIGTGAVNSTTGIVGYKPNTCDVFTRRTGFSFLGNDIPPAGGLSSPDYATCCAQCKGTTGCLAFTFNAGQRRCYRKSSIGTGGSNSTTGTSGYNPNTCDGFTRRVGIRINGNTLGSSAGIAAPDFATCCAVCKSTRNCTAFTHSPRDGRCYPKSGSGAGAVPDSTTDSGVRVS